MSERFHPADSYSRAAATPTDADRLTENFEHAVSSGGSVDYQMGSLEVIAAVAIARVRLLEEMLADRQSAPSERQGNVIPLHKAAPATVERPGA